MAEPTPAPAPTPESYPGQDIVQSLPGLNSIVAIKKLVEQTGGLIPRALQFLGVMQPASTAPRYNPYANEASRKAAIEEMMRQAQENQSATPPPNQAGVR